jgi:putative hydrolase
MGLPCPCERFRSIRCGDPFEGVPFFADLAKMLSQQGPVSWDAARQLAHSIALGGESEPNVDPTDRIQLEQLARVADLHVGSTTGLATSVSGTGATIVPVTRAQWLARSFDAYKPLIEAIASALTPRDGGDLTQPQPADPEAFEQDPEAAMGAWLGGMMQMLSPMMLGMTAGSMIGHLATRSLGQYDLPGAPPGGQDEILFVVRNVDEFGTEWSLDRDELRLWVCLHEIAHHSVLSVPHVGPAPGLLDEFAVVLRPRLGRARGPPRQLRPQRPAGPRRDAVDVLRSRGPRRSDALPAQEAILPQLEALIAAIVGYVDWVMDTTGERIMSTYGQITEAMRRRRVEAAPSDRFVGQLLGLDLTQALYDRGTRFVDGIVERGGPEGLDQLWRSERELPTPAEIDAPGLWLARIELPTTTT